MAIKRTMQKHMKQAMASATETKMDMAYDKAHGIKESPAEDKQDMNMAVGQKIRKIMKEGVRRNTRKPVSKSNPRRKVSQKQAVAIAESMTKKGRNA